MKSAPYFTDDTIVFGILMLLLAFVFYSSSSENKNWKKFYVIFPSLLMCYLLPSILSTMNIISPEWETVNEAEKLLKKNLTFTKSRVGLCCQLL
jgi:ABC-type transport system involved in multi-copper enzyme maturation permease subunit